MPSQVNLGRLLAPDQMTNKVEYEAWLEVVETYFKSLSLSKEHYHWLVSVFRCVRDNPEAKEVHFNYARYRMAGVENLAFKQSLASIITWVEEQFDCPGFNWNNLLMYWDVEARSE